MSTLTAPRMLTLEEFAAMPDDGVERELIRGEVRERAMTRRNRNHSKVEHRINKILGIWLDTQPEPGGEIVSGEAGFDLSRNPDSGVGIDVAYVSAEVAARNPDSAYYEGRRSWRSRSFHPPTRKRTSTIKWSFTWKPASRSSGSSIRDSAR